jgi:hypothetical protein
MKNQTLKRLLKETMPPAEMQPHNDIMLLNQNELIQIGGSGCGQLNCSTYDGSACGTLQCALYK